jgi:hypothetical protein
MSENSVADSSVQSNLVLADEPQTHSASATQLINPEQPASAGEAQKELSVAQDGEVEWIDTDPIGAFFPDDSETYDYFLRFLTKNMALPGVYHQNFEERLLIKITDEYQYPRHDIPFKITDQNGKTLWKGVTFANGEGVIYPNLMFTRTPEDLLFLEVDRTEITVRKAIEETEQRITALAIPDQTALEYVDILFIFDLDGQLKSEFQYLQNKIAQIYSRIQEDYSALSLRVGFITYFENLDNRQISRYEFSSDIEDIQILLNNISYYDGSDEPENIQYALQAAIREMSWRQNALKFSLLVTDAVPYVDYEQTYTYIDAALEANRRGIMIYTLGLSGTELVSEYMLRQISALTYGRFIPLSKPVKSVVADRVEEPGFSALDNRLDNLIISLTEKEISCRIPQLSTTPGQAANNIYQ